MLATIRMSLPLALMLLFETKLTLPPIALLVMMPLAYTPVPAGLVLVPVTVTLPSTPAAYSVGVNASTSSAPK